MSLSQYTKVIGFSTDGISPVRVPAPTCPTEGSFRLPESDPIAQSINMDNMD